MNSLSPTKKILRATLVSFSLFSFVYDASAATEVINPRTNNWTTNTSYKPTLDTITNSSMFTSVPGCTNITNKIQKSIGSILTTSPDKLIDISESFKESIGDNVTTTDRDVGDSLKTILRATEDEKFRAECIDGIGYQLAKKQLSDITQKTLNWTAKGYDGDPLFVRNPSAFYQDISNKEVLQSAKLYGGQGNSTDYPFGKTFARSAVSATKAENNVEESLKSDLRQSLSGGSSLDEYSRDFSVGGWNGWLALTQKPQNNPLGFTMLASQYTAEQSAEKIQNQKDELNQNNGFLSQKRCVELYPTPSNPTGAIGGAQGAYTTGNGACKTYETITPGSVIAEQVVTALTSPIRQLELADGVNESLGGVFSRLLNQLGLQGLVGLSSFGSGGAGWTEVGGSGFGSNSTRSTTSGSFGSLFSGASDEDTILSVQKGEGWWDSDDTFDLTKNLGNSYIRTEAENLGPWDAKNNKPELVAGVGTKNTYYIVSTAGNTELSEPAECFPVQYAGGGTSNCWGRGDAVFFDGESWVSAKYINGVNAKSGFKNAKTGKKIQVIDKKGVIQIQHDYIKAVKASQKELPKIMPAIGALDYCIPGPNPSWYESAELAGEALAGYIGGISLDPNTLQIVAPAPGQYKTLYFGTKPWKQLSPTKFENLFETYFSIDPNQFASAFMTSFKSNAFGGGSSGFTGDIVGDIVGSIFGGNSGPSASDIAFQQAFAEAQGILEEQKAITIDGMISILGQYKEAIDAVYGQGSPMTTELLIDPVTENATKNPAYLPMSLSGIAITKNIRIYDLNIEQADKDYRDLIDEGVSNIYKLNIIKERVDKIIKAAQARRAREVGVPIPAECLANETITYLSDGTKRTTLDGFNTNTSDDTWNGIFDGVTGVTGTPNTGVINGVAQ